MFSERRMQIKDNFMSKYRVEGGSWNRSSDSVSTGRVSYCSVQWEVSS